MPRRYPPTTHIGVKLDRADLAQLDALVAAGPNEAGRSGVLRAGIRVLYRFHLAGIANAMTDDDLAEVLAKLGQLAGRLAAHPADVLAALVSAPDAERVAKAELEHWATRFAVPRQPGGDRP